ncbi:hypothetical protein ACOI8A_24055 [Pseudomonas sp. P4795]|uniref:hypothetical protein n=1 Tax=Pseudomonas sp. P4795 TaxID=3409915 RepID=UPI003B5AEF45
MLAKDLSEEVRSGELVIDFVSIEISQLAEAGIKIEGHGILKINAGGALVCDVICTKAENLVLEKFGTNYPLDYGDSKQTLRFKAVDLSGKVWVGENFSLRLRMLRVQTPFKFSIFLSEIVHKHKQDLPLQQHNYLWFESFEYSRIPKNKTNTIDDSLTGQSMTWNQTDFDLVDYKVSIIDNKYYTTIYANGVFDVEDLYSALKFYVGFTSGTMPTAYVMTTRTGSDVFHHIRSINKKINKTIMPHPIDELLMLGDGKWNNSCHFELLNNILYVQDKFPQFFDSTVSQWKRVWQGFNAQQSITALALTVSIEGLLIDLFIPKLERDEDSPEFEQQKERIIKLLAETEINPLHLETIVKSVQRWGNIHANAALTILAKKGLITKQEVQAWKDLRNSSTHPKFSEMTIEREIKERTRLTRCLNLYYKLNLNIYAYTGGYIVYDSNETMSTMFPQVSIFDLYGGKSDLPNNQDT